MTEHVYEEPTEWAFCALPLDWDEARHVTVYVRLRSGSGPAARYVVQRRDREALGVDGAFDWEPSPSNREDDWIATHRFDLETAKRLAREIAPKLGVNKFGIAELRQLHQQYEEEINGG